MVFEIDEEFENLFKKSKSKKSTRGLGSAAILTVEQRCAEWISKIWDDITDKREVVISNGRLEQELGTKNIAYARDFLKKRGIRLKKKIRRIGNTTEYISWVIYKK